MAPADLRTLMTGPVGTFIRRRRRILAALCAGLAAVIALGAVRAPAPTTTTPSAPVLAAGEVAVPVQLMSAAIAETLRSGNVIDLVAVPRTGEQPAEVVATDVTVMSVASNSGFGTTAAPVVVVAVPRPTALAIADVTASHAFTAWVTAGEAHLPEPAPR